MLRKTPIWQVILFLLASISAFGVLAALVFLLITTDAPANGGTYTEAIAGSPQSLNPLVAAFNEPDRDLTSLLFSGLTKLRKDGAIQPDLAESWQVSEDGKSYTFLMRRDAEWHDGRPVSADDAVYTYQTLASRDLPTDPEIIALWSQVKPERQDQATLRLSMAQPFSPFLSYTTVGLAPNHIYQGINPKALTANGPNIVGSGMFRLKQASMDQVVLEANPKAYSGRPRLDTLDFRFFRDDAAVAAALVNGNVDGALLYPTTGKEAMDRIASLKDMTVRYLPRANYSVLFLNSGNPIFQNKLVRKALSAGINRDELVTNIAGGFGRAADNPIPIDSWAFNSNAPSARFDPTEAAKLLDEAGWKTGATAVREKDGQSLRFSLLTNNDKVRVSTAEDIARQYKRLGVQVDVQASGITGLMQNFLIPRKYDAILFGMDPGYDPDPYPYWHSTQTSTDGLNVAAYTNPEMDTLLGRARTAGSIEERKQLYARFQELFAEEVPSVVLYHPLYAYAMNGRVKGVDTGPLYDTSSRFGNVKDWYLLTQRVVGS